MKKKSIKLLIVAMVATMTMGVFAGCGSKDNAGDEGEATGKEVTISISGSTSVGPLMAKEAESFKQNNSNVNIEIQEIGSSAGIKNVISGVSEIGMASRDLKPEEKSEVAETTICYDGIALVVNPKNKATDLTMDEIKDIYTGKITNWKEVGGADAPIVVVSREDGSGTRAAFEELVGYKAEELLVSSTIAEGNGSVKTTVATNENAIGFVSFETIDDTVTPLTVAGVKATPDNVLNKTYPLSRPFIVVYKEGGLSTEGKALIDFILSDVGQQIVEEKGGIKLAK